eukprot:CAMPEP_0204872480 /NCGR_PEP_ID=MMETSP1348-20121228/38341_1 /ASSEMBLY_ACC=CAM_ASM_000700 /TAXON_ID=215587 /ORGANISM="Aplanochytrium stocchinoi, Strain GSBS06" /LENGTH=824 /DNA_ID=CAMNT_0052027371 /DNA_START=76 /DNA_END=2550 /DNA_ORIENTATION=-
MEHFFKLKFRTLLCVVLFTFVTLNISYVNADVYMHNPLGGNDRNCGGTGANRDNGDRLFDSQNNDKGGYSCPRSFPFPCYKYSGFEKSCCNGQNILNPNKDMVDRFGNIVESEITLNNANCSNVVPPTKQDTMYYYEGSVLRIQWTNQHGFGQNTDLHSNVLIQYACDDTLTDSCGEIPAGQENYFPFGEIPGAAKSCYLRDGYPVNNNNANDNLNGRATRTIPFEDQDNLNNEGYPDPADVAETNSYQDDYRYGRHETLEYYRQCLYRQRNKGLFIADQNVRDLYGATATRQNPNGNQGDNNRDGYECPEESEYYPYWHWTPWKDIVNIVDNDRWCWRTRHQSGNIRFKGRCTGCSTCRQFTIDNNDIGQPNNEIACEAVGGQWVWDPPHGVDMPECIIGSYGRVNHLGDIQGGGMPHYDWKIPEPPGGGDSARCVLRIRYNISTRDFDSKTWQDSDAAGDFLQDDNSGEIASYRYIEDFDEDNRIKVGNRVGINVNSNQHGRVFQDRSYVFEIRKREDGMDKLRKIHNVNVRGKRGNIVDVYPSVEYDFAPSQVECTKGDSIHIQWTGSDYNPSRGDNSGEGGPLDPTNSNVRSDRSNLVERQCEACNTPISHIDDSTFFEDKNTVVKMATLDQTDCLSIEELRAIPSLSHSDRERHHQNCAKINTAHPYFDGGVHKCNQGIGDYYFMSTRNNNFSNRDMKLRISVRYNTKLVLGLTFAALGLLMLAGVWLFRRRRKKNKEYGKETKEKLTKAANAVGGMLSSVVATPKSAVTAKYDYKAKEANELTFRKGDSIEVLKRSPSGWWDGRLNGREGLFPSTYVM